MWIIPLCTFSITLSLIEWSNNQMRQPKSKDRATQRNKMRERMGPKSRRMSKNRNMNMREMWNIEENTTLEQNLFGISWAFSLLHRNWETELRNMMMHTSHYIASILLLSVPYYKIEKLKRLNLWTDSFRSGKVQ